VLVYTESKKDSIATEDNPALYMLIILILCYDYENGRPREQQNNNSEGVGSRYAISMLVVNLKNPLHSWKGTQLPEPTSGPNEPELNRIFNVRGLFFTAKTNETDTVIDSLGAVPVANVQRHSLPLHVKE